MTQGRSYVRVVVVLLGLLYSICLTEAQYNPPNGIYSFPLALTIRDQRNGPIGGSDFNNLGQTSPYIPSVPAYGVITGLVLPQLGADGTPTLNPNRTPGYISILTTKNDTFSQWYHDVTWDGAPVMKFIYYITMTWNSASGVYSYNNQAFFPLDGLGWGNQGLADGNGVLHNFGFTVMFSTQFTYTGSGTLSYTGDDSVWVFINNKLEVDIGGIHSASSNSVDLTTLGLTVGQTYPLDFFFAEEHTTASTILIETTFPFTSVSAMSNITLNSTSVAACCSFFANTPLDNTHPSVKNTTYALTSTASVRVTFLCSTVTTVGYSFGLVDPAQTVAFPDIRSHANGGILYAGNTWTSSPYASGSVLTLWIQTPTTTYYSMLNGTNMFAQIYYPSVGTVVGIRLANTVGRPYDDLVVRIEVLGTWQNSSVPTYTPETCTSFTPPQNLTFEASCVDYAPDDCGCSITPTLPNGWDIAQLDSGTMAVFQNYGSRWRSTCFGVMSQGVLVGYSTAGSCTLPTPPSVYRTISPQGQVCLSTCSFPYLLRTTSVDTTCNLNIYGKNCATNSVSTAYINPLLPNGVAVSLVGTTPTPVLTLPTLPIPNTIAIQFVQDLSIATGTQNVYAQSVINTLCSQLGASYLWVSCSYAYYASTLTMNYGFVSSNSFTAATVPPQYTNINTNTPAASTSGMSTYQVLNTIANDPNVGFQSGNVQNIIVFLSMSPVGSAGTYLTAALNSTLILAGITPVFVSPYDYTGIIPFLPYAVSYKTGSLTWTGVTATLSAPVLASITSVINRVYIGLRAQDDPWNIVSFPNTIGQPSNVAFQDNSVSGDYTVVTSKAGTNNPEYYINVAVCRKLGPLISVPINTLFTSPLPNSILTTDLVLTNSAENCSCSLTPLPTVAAYIASDPLTSRYSTFPNYPGPVLYVFGRGQYNIYVSTYTTPVPSFTTPSSYIQVVALSNWTSPVLYNGPGPWLGSQYALTVKVVGLEWTTFYSSSSTYSPTDSGMSILGSYSAYLSLFLTDQGATIANCSTPPPTAAFKLKSAFGMLGKLIIRYRLCDNCSCSNTAVLPVLFYRATDLPPVGSNLTVSVNASKSISINIIVSDPDDLKTNLAISFNPSTFPSSSIGKLVDINGNTIPTNTNTGLTVSSTSYQNVTFSAGPYPQTVVIQYYVTDPLGLSNTYYITVIILPLFSVPKITVCPTPILTPRVVLVSSTIEIDFNPGQVVSLVLRPPTPTAPIGILYYNVSSLSYIISNPITVDTTLSSVTLDSSGSIVYTVYFEASPFFPNTQVLTSLWYASTPTGVNSGTTSTATNTLTIRVTPNNLPNNINAIAQKNFTQNTPVKIIFTGTDPDSYDNANLTLAFPVLPTFGVLSGLNNMSIVAGAWCLVADRVTSAIGTSYAITYTPFTGYYGTDSFTWAFFDIAAVMNYSDRASETADQVTFQMTIIQTQKGVTCSNQAFNVLPITRPNPTSVAIVYLPMKLTFQVLPVGTTPVINMTIAGCSITKNNYLSTTVNGVNTNLTTFPITFSSSGPWTFTYTQNALMTTGQDTCSYYTTGAFGYRSTDNGGSNCTFNIIQRPFTPPVATGATFYLKEGENITINMGNSNYFYDANGDWLVAVNVNQTLNTTTVGSLVSATSTSLTFPYSVPTTDGVTFSLIFSSVSIIVGTCCNKTTQFSFTFTDSTGQVSNTAIMTFVVTPVDHAPTLSINGSTTGFSVTRARNSSAVLAITISDVDSDWGILQLPRNQFPWGSGAGSVVTITDSLSPFTTTVITQTSTVLVSNVSFLVSRSRLFYLTWTPAITNPDGLSSLSFTAQAQDAEGLQSSEIPIPLSITLNNNPVANPCSVVNVLENGAVTFTVSGTDPDPWHNLVLDFSLTVTPTKGTIAINTTTGTTALGTTWIPVTQIPNLSTSMTIRSLVYTPNYLYSGNDTCSFQFRDLLGAVSNVQILVIQVAHVNHPPTSSSLYITTTLNTPVPFSLTAADIDGNALTFLIKSNISVFTGNHGTMMLTSTSNVLTTATNISAGAGNTLNFIYTPPYGLQVSDNPYFTFYVYDGTVASGPYIVQVTVTKPLVYDPPTCENFTVTTNQETALGIVLDNYVKGYDGIPFTVKVISVPANGNLTSNGALVTVGMTIVANTGSPIYSTTYTPPYLFWGVDYFEFEATDIYGLASIPGICTINVIHVDKPPVLVVGVTSVNVSRNTNAIIPITVYDVDSATIIVSITGSVPTPSTLTINTTSPVPTPLWSITNTAKGVPQKANLYWNPAILLPDGASSSIQLKATDTEGKTDGPDTVTLYVVPNNAPTNLGGGPVTLPENTAAPGVNINVTGSDLDPYDKSVLSVQITTTPTMGKLSLAGTQVVQDYWYSSTLRSNIDGQNTVYTLQYVPNQYSFGIDSFSIQFKDQLGAPSTIKQVIINVTFSNTPPSSASKTITVNIQQPTAFNIPGPTDPDPNDPTTIHILPPGPQWIGKMTFGSDPNFAIPTSTPYTETGNTPWTFYYTSYVLNTTYFNFYCTDTHGGVSPTYTITIITVMNPSDLPPVAKSMNYTIYENNNLPINFGDLITDAFGDSITWVQIVSNVDGSIGPDTTIGSLSNLNTNAALGTTADNSVMYPTNSLFNAMFTTVTYASGVTSFLYKAGTSGMTVSNVATIQITVIHVDQPPTLTINGSTTTLSVKINRTSTVTFLANFSDIDSVSGSLLMPQNNFPFGTSGTFSTVTLQNTASLSLVTLNSASYSIATDVNFPIPGRYIMYLLSWTPSAYLPDGQSSGSFALQGQDVEGLNSIEILVNLAVYPNNQPVCDPVDLITVPEDSSVNFTVSGYDPDPWHTLLLSFCITQIPTQGTLTLGSVPLTSITCVSVSSVPNPSLLETVRNLHYTPTIYWYGNDSFSYQFTDLLGLASAPQTVYIQITHVNHPPKSSNYSLNTTLNTPLPFTIVGTDIDKDKLTFHIGSDVSVFTGIEGTISLASTPNVYLSTTTSVIASTTVYGTANFIYNPPFGLEVHNFPTFSFYVDDGQANVGPYYVNVYVGAPLVKYYPYSNDFTATLNQETPLNIILDTHVGDPAGISISVSITSVPSNGVLYLQNGTEIEPGTIIPAGPSSPIYNITYVPNYLFWGTDDFSFQATDIYGTESIPGNCTLNVIHVNKPPSLYVSVTSLFVGRTTTASIPFTTIDLDSLTIAVTLSGVLPKPAQVLLNGTSYPVSLPNPLWAISNAPTGVNRTNTLQWVPDILLPDGSNCNISFLATDTEGATSTTCYVYLLVKPNNIPTNLGSPNVTAVENSAGVSITVTGNDLDSYDMSVLSVLVQTLPTLGKLSIGSNPVVANNWYDSSLRINADGSPTSYTFAYVPTQYKFGNDSFIVQFKDQIGAVSPNVTVYINVTFSNTPPSSSDLTVNCVILEWRNFTLAGPYDPDPGDTTTIHILPTSNWVGSLVFEGATNFNITSGTTFTRPGGYPWIFSYRGTLLTNTTFTFFLTDTNNGQSPNYVVTIITSSDLNSKPPVVTSKVFSLQEDSGPIIFDLFPLISDPQNNAILWLKVLPNPSGSLGINPQLGQLSNYYQNSLISTVNNVMYPYQNTFLFEFTPALHAWGVSSFLYCVEDAAYETSGNATITINVTHIDYPPTLSMTPNGQVIGNRNSTTVFTVTVADIDSVSGYLILSFPFGTSNLWSLFKIYDMDLGTPSVQLNQTAGTIASPSFLLNNTRTTRTFTLLWTPSISIPDGTTGSFAIQAEDIEGKTSSSITVYLSVSPNHYPTITPVSTITLNEDSNYTFSVYGQDADPWHNLVLDFSINQGPSNGNAYLNGDIPLIAGTWITAAQVPNTNTLMTARLVTYVPTLYWFGTDTLSFQFRDLLGAVSPIITVNAVVTHVNHPPQSKSYNLTTPCNTPLSFSVPATDLDKGDTLTFIIGASISVFTGNQGTLTLASSNVQLTTAYNVTASSSRTLDLVYKPPFGLEVTDFPSFSFFVYDGTVSVGPYYIQISVGPPITNNPPYSNPTNVTVYQESSVNIALDNFVGDVDGNPITVYITSIPADGVLKLSNGVTATVGVQIPVSTSGAVYQLTYYPKYMYWGSDVFTFQSKDIYNNVSSSAAPCNINVIHIDKPPVIFVDQTSLAVARTTNGTVHIIVYDVDSVSITVTLSGTPPSPSALNINNSPAPSPFWYIDNSQTMGENHTAAMQWVPSIMLLDGKGWDASLTATDTEGKQDGPLTVVYSVTPNHVPTNLGGGPVVVTENKNMSFLVSGNDQDWYDQSVLSIMVTTVPTNGQLYLGGTVVVSGQWYPYTLSTNSGSGTQYNFTYKPYAYFFGSDSASFDFQDRLGAISSIVTVNIDVTFMDTPPSSGNLNVTVYINIPTQFTLIGPFDPDTNDPTTIHINPPGSVWSGKLAFSSDSSFDITSNKPYNLTAPGPWIFFYTSYLLTTTTFTYYLTDTHNGTSPIYYVNIRTIINPNDKPPNATNFVVTTYENEAIEFDFAQYITDPNNEMIISVTIQDNLGGPTLMGPDPSLGGIYDFYSGLQFGTSSANATLLATGSTLRTKFIPLLNAHGTTTFTYNCMDYGRSVSNTATVTVVVIWVDIPPTLTVNGGTTPVSALVSRNSTATFNVVMGDIDSNNVTLLMPKNTIPFGTNGLMCTILLTDPTHGLGAVNIISTTTTLINQLPLPPRSRSFTISWTPSISIPDGQSSGMFFLQAMDSEGKDSTEITVNLATTLNQIPVSYTTSPVTLLEDGSTSIILVGTDPDPWHNLVLNFCITQLPLHGTVALGNLVLTVTCIPVSTTYPNTDTAGTLRNITYTPVQYWSGSDSFSYEFQDLLGATSPVQTVSLSVTHVNHPPVSKGLSLYTPLNTLLPFTLSGSDVDNDQLYFLIDADVSKFTGSLGTIKLKTGQSVTTAMNVSASSSGTLDFIYTPPYGLPVTNYPSFTFYIYEFSASGPYTVNVTVGPPTTRDPPVSNSFNASLNQDTSVKLVFDTYVSDPDGIPITVWLLSLPTDGTLSLPSGLTISSVPIQLVASTGSPLYYLNYIPKTEWWGLDQFQYYCIDLFNTTSVPGTVGITVIHIDSPPSITVTPSTQTVQRTFSGIIEVSVVDIDSASINVTLTTENVPALSVLSFVGGTPIPTPLWYIDNRNVKGIRQYANLSWTPEILLGDGSTGDLVFLATDTEGKTGGPVAVSFAVLKNNPPTNLGGGPVNISENNPGVSIVVTGNDLDPYDKSVLSIMVTSVPTLGTFTLGNTVVQKNTWYKSNLRSNSDGQPTTYTFQYVPTPYVYGSDSFTIMFQDQLGAPSPAATVNIVINFVDVPPTSNNVTVTGYIQTQVQIRLPGPVNPENNPVTLHIIPPPVAWQGALTLNSDASFSINNLTSKYTLTGGSPWIFSYLSNVVVTVSFQFYLTDNKGGSSPNYTATLIITENPAILPPVAENGYFNVTEGSTCIFDFLSLVLNRDNENIIWVEIMNNVNSTVTVGPDPNLGSLRSANGIPFGSASTSAYLTPVANSATPFLAHFVSVSSGFATFTYRVCDASILVSNVATITIDIIHVNFPPVLVIKPTSTLIEPRGDTGVFTITVTDSDSSLVTLYIRNDYDNPLPLEYSTLSFIPSPAGSTVPVTNDTTYTNLTTQYTPFVATISYMPFITMPDSTTGTFVIQACDIHGDCSSEQTGSTGVTPNHPPVVVDLTGSDYNLINTEGEMRIITLTGSDPDSYHTTKLTFIFPSLTKNGPLCLCDLSGNLGQTIQQTDPPFSILGQPDYVHNRTTLVVCYSPLEFYLSVDPITGEDVPDTFRFNVVDLLGASSATKLVSINTNISVPHPPTSINTTLTVNEYDCLVDSCGTPIVNPPFVQIPVTALDATATSNYSLNFIWGSNETIPGQLFYIDSNGNFTNVPLNTPLPRPWKFYYQPSGQTGESPVLILTLPYIIRVDNSYTPEYYLSIFVDPVNKPPVGANIDFTSPMNVPANVNLTHWDPDEPSDSLTLYVVSISFTNQATFASLDGTPISLNKPFNFWNLVATPNLDVYSNPSTTPIAQIQYQIVDPVQLSSDIYTVSYFVTYVYYPIQYAANPNTTMAEDTTVLITLDNNGPGGWFGGNKEYQSVTITLTNFHNDSKPGNYSICNSLSQCTPVSQSNLPVQIPHGSRLRYTPEYNENGQNYSRFDFNVTPAAYPEVPIVEVTWTINVTPINDPPVTIPLNYIPSTALTGYTANRCDENTTFIAAFIATDIDSPLSSLRSVWLTLLDDMPYTFYNCDNVTNLDHSLRNSSCAQGVVMDVDLPEIPRSSIANWKVILVPDLGYYTSFRAVSFAVYTLDNYNAPSIPVKATINVDPINSPPYFVPIGPEGELFAQSNQGNYVLISGIVRDPNFVSGYQVLLTVTTQDGTLGLPLSASKCVLSNNNQTLTCQDLIEKVNLFFNEKSPPGIVFYPPSSEFSLSATIFFNVNDLGNIDKNKPPHKLSANGTCIVTQIASVTVATAKEGSSSVTSIAVGVGVACAVGIGIAAAFLFKSSKAATDLYLAEFVSNLDSAGNMYNPLYTEATKKAVNPFYSAGGAATG